MERGFSNRVFVISLDKIEIIRSVRWTSLDRIQVPSPHLKWVISKLLLKGAFQWIFQKMLFGWKQDIKERINNPKNYCIQEQGIETSQPDLLWELNLLLHFSQLWASYCSFAQNWSHKWTFDLHRCISRFTWIILVSYWLSFTVKLLLNMHIFMVRPSPKSVRGLLQTSADKDIERPDSSVSSFSGRTVRQRTAFYL